MRFVWNPNYCYIPNSTPLMVIKSVVVSILYVEALLKVVHVYVCMNSCVLFITSSVLPQGWSAFSHLFSLHEAKLDESDFDVIFCCFISFQGNIIVT